MTAAHQGDHPAARQGTPGEPRAGSGPEIGVCAAALCAEIALVALHVSGRAGLALAIGLHAAVVVALAIALDRWERRRRDSRLIAITLVTVSVSGPLGALLSLVLGVWLGRVSVESTLLDRWYERISGDSSEGDAALLYEQIRSGRTLSIHADAGARLAPILRHGPLADKQRALGLIAHKYHADFSGLLSLALRNADPPIRVQAAAVAARLRSDERARLKSTLAEADGAALAPADSIRLAQSLLQLLRTGLLDEQDRAAAHERARSLAGAACTEAPDARQACLVYGELLALAGAHEEAAAVLAPLAAAGDSEAQPIYRASLMRLGRYRELAHVGPGGPTGPG